MHGPEAGRPYSVTVSETGVPGRGDPKRSAALPPRSSTSHQRTSVPVLAVHPELPGAKDSSPDGTSKVPPQAVAYVDGYGNLKTTWCEPPAEPGTRVVVRVGHVEAEAVVGGGTFAVPAGELSFAPGSSGWTTRDGGQRRWCELLARGGSAAELFGFPTPGTSVAVDV